MLSFIPKRKTGVSKTKRQTYASRDYLLHILNWIKNYTSRTSTEFWLVQLLFAFPFFGTKFWNSSSYKCDCKVGYKETPDGDCEDVDECPAGFNAQCNENAECINTIGSFRCRCNDGYAGDGMTCVNFNECSTGSHNCPANSNCIDKKGHYACDCIDGWTMDDSAGDDKKCIDLDECDINEHNCHVLHGVCLNTIGSYDCECDVGFQGTGFEGTRVS